MQLLLSIIGSENTKMNKNYIKNLIFVFSMNLSLFKYRIYEIINYLRKLSNLIIGNKVKILSGLRISGKGKIIIGDNSIIQKNVHLVVKDPKARILIGNNVKIEDEVQLICSNSGEIHISNNVILGRGVKIVCNLNAKVFILENAVFHQFSELRTNTLIEIGSNSVIGKFSSISPREENGNGYFVCGKKCGVHEHNFLDTTEKIEFGDEVATGPYDIFYTHDHSTKNGISIWEQPVKTSSIHIGGGSWIGSQVIILPGVSLGIGSVIGAGAVVTKSFDDYQIIGGIPAKLLKVRE